MYKYLIKNNRKLFSIEFTGVRIKMSHLANTRSQRDFFFGKSLYLLSCIARGTIVSNDSEPYNVTLVKTRDS